MDEYKNIIVEKEGKIAVLSINRPKELNALNYDTMAEIDCALDGLEKDPDVLALIITGGGEKAFVAGADIGYMAPLSAFEGKNWAATGQKVFSKIDNFPHPVIAAVNGFALGGGCEIALACDIRIASEKARFGQPEVTLGIIPGFAGTQRLQRLVGKGQAKLLIFSANMIDANEALRIGLVEQLAAPENLMAKAKELANKIISNAPLAVKQAKLAINNGSEMPSEQSYAFEAEAFGLCFATHDQKEGMQAFLQKRKAEFKEE